MAFSRRGLLAAAAAAPLLMRVEDALAQGIQPKRGGTLNSIVNPEPPVLHVGVNNQAPTLIVGGKIFQGLLRYDAKLNPMPELAKRWEVSPDGLEYTFHLQENVKFHDGQPMTADDVVFSIMKFHMEVSPRARGVFARIKEGVAVNPTTAKFTLSAPFEPFLLMFDVTVSAIVPKHLFDGQDYRQAPAVSKPIGTGPFRFVEWQRGNFIRLERFADYWKPGQPYLDAIIYRVVPDSQSRRLALESGQVQLTQSNDIEPFDVPQMRARPNLEVRTEGWEYFGPLMWMEFNHRVKPLDDVRVRRALTMAVNRDFIAQRLWFGIGKPATGPFHSATRFYDGTAKSAAFNVEEAKKLLDAAGLKPNGQGVRFAIKHMSLPYGEVFTRLGEFLRQSFRQVGVELQLESVDVGTWAQRTAAWEFDTTINYLYQYGDPTLGVERSYVSTNIKKILFSNVAGYSNPKVDELFTQGRDSADPKVRQTAFSAVQKILVEEAPLLWLLEMSFPSIYDKKLQNVITSGSGIHACFDDVFLA
ncbi:peptide ABC transporter substrate-binding protein [Pseudoroseomonas deserti]|uniref:Peptide ABC transporter substrate-binding protein n=1 Tax=Teichococcus deserti TaxID=1817963 RepID=A0A1V2H7L7_9PROT|nr:ABC transporter substrate-binding protein [Pseudoroseomonas deserti]ONG57319.1 peptide ABC transporter substrate-binding protein [Pseudoroseomonas deserti]